MTVEILLNDGNTLIVENFEELHYNPFDGDAVTITPENCSQFSIGNLRNDVTVTGSSVISVLAKEVKAVIFHKS